MRRTSDEERRNEHAAEGQLGWRRRSVELVHGLDARGESAMLGPMEEVAARRQECHLLQLTTKRVTDADAGQGH